MYLHFLYIYICIYILATNRPPAGFPASSCGRLKWCLASLGKHSLVIVSRVTTRQIIAKVSTKFSSRVGFVLSTLIDCCLIIVTRDVT